MARPTKQSKINQKISESLREELKNALPRLKESASRGDKSVKQYKYAGISERTYYRWLQENPQLKQELAQLSTDFRKAKIKEAALIGAPVSEQRLHANKLTAKEYDDIMRDDPEFAEEVESTRECNLKLWSRRNIAVSRKKKCGWRYLEHIEKDMNKVRLIVENDEDKEISEEDQALLNEYEDRYIKKKNKKV